MCQLDALARCRNRATLRKSLATLPQTLDQTYDRILTAISEEDQDYALRILQWLTFSARPLSVEEVAEVVAIDVAGNRAFNRDEVLEDPLEALNICSSLVTVTTNQAERFTPSTANYRSSTLFGPRVSCVREDQARTGKAVQHAGVRLPQRDIERLFDIPAPVPATFINRGSRRISTRKVRS